jgi:hypothetical protein
MVRRVTPAQFQSLMRQQLQKQKQAIDKYNREVRAHNQKVRQAVNAFNREVSAYNARVRANRQRLRNEIARLNRQANSTTRYATFRTSVRTVHSAYERLEQAAGEERYDDRYNEILDLSEKEAANSAGMMNALMGETPEEVPQQNSLESPLTPLLQAISGDLGDRWKGALYSLNPQNPDAARHFCTSAREIIARILNEKAPDAVVIAKMPDCQRTPNGTPSRRAKIRYFLNSKGMAQSELEEFVEDDMENVVQLFEEFNQGTHGSAGTFNMVQLQTLRKRVEDGIVFLSRVVN